MQASRARIAILGAGAIGGHLAAKLADAGHEVTAIARGDAVEHLRRAGITLRVAGAERHARPRVAANLVDAGEQDLLIVAVKATSVNAPLAAELAVLRDRRVPVLFIANGIPWWYELRLRPKQKLGHAFFGTADAMVRALDVGQMLGGVVYSANTVIAPGLISNNSPSRNKVTIAGVAAGQGDALAASVQAMLKDVHFDVQRSDNIIEEVWRKLVLNLCVPPLCIASGVSADGIARDGRLRETFRRSVAEAHAIARSQGFLAGVHLDADDMLAGMPAHTPSMVADFLAGRPIEQDAVLDVPLALARAAGIAVPVLDTLAAVVARRVADRLEIGSP